MIENNLGEIVCQAIDTIVSERINEVNFDRTIVCTIVDDSKKKDGKYKVSYNSLTFYAYTENTNLSTNNTVYVQIPNGDWNEQKLILSKKIDKTEDRVIYHDPFDSFVDITNNIISKSFGPNSLVANSEDEDVKEILLWSYNIEDSGAIWQDSGEIFAGYTRLGITAAFQSLLYDFQAQLGDYGLRLEIEIAPDSSDTNNQTLTTKYCQLGCNNMIGNPYNFDSYYTQKKLYDIGPVKNIKTMKLYFYQEAGSFLDKDNRPIPWEGLPPNLFVKDITVSLGYDANTFEDDTLIIYSLDSSKYRYDPDNKSDINHKKLQVRWIHRFNDDKIKVVQLNDSLDYNLIWYRKRLGQKSDNVYSGVDWAKLSTQEVFNKNGTYTILDDEWIAYNDLIKSDLKKVKLPSYNTSLLLPDTNKEEEQIKALLFYDDKQVYSNILSFTNDEEVVSQPTINASQALSIVCEDNTFGNYFIYKLDGEILDRADGNVEREFKAYFRGDQLTEAESIEWIIPTTNTMVVLEKNFLSAFEGESGSDEPSPSDELPPFQSIIRRGTKSENWALKSNTQKYKIKKLYSQQYTNNTIKCVVNKDGIEYTATKELTFGPAGTAGTNYTFVLDFDTENALTIGSDEKVLVSARLYDYKGKEVKDLENLNITWSWLNGTNNLIKRVLVKDENNNQKNNQIELQLIDSNITLVPTDNYSILKATLEKSASNGDNGWGDYDLNAYLPIPIRNDRKYEFISGATVICYNSLGYLDSYFQNPYNIYGSYDGSVSWNLSYADSENYAPKIWIDEKTEKTYIKPLNIYVAEALNNICIYGSINGTIVWSQPIYIYQDKYPSSIINDWNGELTIDNANNAILAAKIVAGRKEEDNKFSGVMMGDWRGNDTSSASGAIAEHTGLYGFHQGEASFGFKDDGTAFIGKPGFGRIEFIGDSGIIKSASYSATDINDENSYFNKGMQIDLLEGSIDAHQFSLTAGNIYKKGNSYQDGSIYINTSEGITINENNTITLDMDATPFRIGSKFRVNWDGSIWANGGTFIGTISADGGDIGGWIIGPDRLTSETGTVYLASDGTISGATIQAGKLMSNSNSNRITLEGYLNINDKLYLGHIKGTDGKGASTDLHGIVSSGGMAIEANGNDLRIGSPGKDNVILSGDSVRWHSNGVVGTGEKYNPSQIYLKAQVLKVEVNKDNQSGIYARFA